MSSIYYTILFIVSLVLTAAYLFLWHTRDDVHITLIFTLVPIVNLGYLLLGQAASLNDALFATKITYLGGCFLQMIIVLAVFSLCKIRMNRWVRLAFLFLSTAIYTAALTIGRNQAFYVSASFSVEDGYAILQKEYGPLHAVFYGVVFAYFVVGIATILYALVKKNQVSRKLLLLLFLPQLVCMLLFFVGRLIYDRVELIPVGYVFAQLLYLLIARRIQLYNVTDTAFEAMVEAGETGFIIFDHHFRYLGSNEVARQVLPGLGSLTVDLPLNRNPEMEKLLLPWLEQYRDHPDEEEDNEHLYPLGEKVWQFAVGPLKRTRAQRGYRMVITDDSKDQTIIRMEKNYSADLKQQVDEQTAHIVRMNENLVVSMAVMVESRDNSTGGHIRRTSDVVRMLTEIMAGMTPPPPGYDMTPEFCRLMERAAPMHDLGKIAVPDAILCKPSRFEPWEFEQMKRHAPEGARIVHEILKDTDDEDFKRVAENVAHYHHERWDGSGYPDGLKGEEIPPEARIMAVADVYDALVSKRVYKESMSFEKAHAIILEGMGTQFDPALREAYLQTEPALQDYYGTMGTVPVGTKGTVPFVPRINWDNGDGSICPTGDSTVCPTDQLISVEPSPVLPLQFESTDKNFPLNRSIGQE